MTLPPPLFQELENVELMLMAKRERVGTNFSYTLGNPDETIVYTIVEEELSTAAYVDPRLPVKFKVMYEGEDVMNLDRIPTKETWYRCIWPCPYTDNFRVYSPAENVIGYVERLVEWIELLRGVV